MVLFQCNQSHLDLDTVRAILAEYRIPNADITLRCDATADDLIDVIEGNRFAFVSSHFFQFCNDKIVLNNLF